MKRSCRIPSLLRCLATICILLGMSRDAGAHPHAWIDIRVNVLFDTDGRIFALQQHWKFDPLYTAFVMEGLLDRESKSPDHKKLEALLKKNLKNLKEYEYFTVVETNAGRMKFSGVRDGRNELVKNRLQMTFTLLLDSPVEATAQPLVYSIYDPTFYIEMLHSEAAGAVQLVNAGAGCRHQLRAPKPDPEAVALAASLDRTQSAGDGLGKFFAERVEIRCGARS